MAAVADSLPPEIAEAELRCTITLYGRLLKSLHLARNIGAVASTRGSPYRSIFAGLSLSALEALQRIPPELVTIENPLPLLGDTARVAATHQIPMAVAELLTVAALHEAPLYYAGRLPRADMRAIAKQEGVLEFRCLDLFGLQSPRPVADTDL